jgi:gluconolactonase
MDRRTLLAALPAAALAAPALAQPPAARPAPAPLPPMVETPSLPMTIVAEGLKFPEGPIAMKDGSLIFVEIERQTVSRLTPAGKVEVVAEVPGGPNGLAIGPDGALWIANNGGRFTFAVRGGLNGPGAPPPGFTAAGKVQRLDLKTGKLTTVYDQVGGKPIVAADDLVFDRKGGLWINDIAVKQGEGQVLYAPAPGKPLVVARSGLSGPNGIGVSPDGKLLHVSMGTNLYAYDIDGPGQLSTRTYPNNGVQAPLWQGSIADSLKIQADGKVCVCSLVRPGGISIIARDGKTEFEGFPDRWVCNLAFGGPDMRDCWVMLSGLGKIAKVRWPAPGQVPAFRA